MLLALVLTTVFLCPLAAAGDLEESSICPSNPTSSFAEKDLHCGEAGLTGDHENEGLSLMQVGAKRLQKAAAAKSARDASTVANATEQNAHNSTGPDAAVASNLSSATALVELATTAKVAKQVQGRVEALLAQASTRSSYTLSIVIVAVVGLVALALLAFALQPGNSARDNLGQGSISQNFPRVTQGGPYGRQQGGPSSSYYPAPDSSKVPGYIPYGAGAADARPSLPAFQSPSRPFQQGQAPYDDGADSLQGSMQRLPDPSQQRFLPRVSTPAVGSARGLPLPRVQGPGARPSSSASRPGTGFNLTPAQSLAPMKQDIDEVFPGSAAMLPAPREVDRAPEVTGFAPRRPPPLCPMLVLPGNEIFLAVPIDQLVAGTSTVEIVGLSGNALLRTTVKDSEEGRLIEVSMSPPRSQPLASISAPTAFGPRAGLRELKGSRGKHYGWLRPAASGYVLRCGEDDVMTVITSSGSGHVQLRACSNGDLLAQASRSSDGEGYFAPEDIEVTVKAGMDAVLAILCVVSAALIAEGPTPFGAGKPRPSGMA